MTINVSIVADSIAADTGIRITTMALTYPRIVHSELMTHRVFSRNASSSRAIPSWRAIAAVLGNPAEPVAWGSNRPGMQATENLKGWRLWLTKRMWHTAKWAAAGCAWVAMKAGAHKQVVNRILEPWSHITVLVTSTDWQSWFALRDHPDADPTIGKLASIMYSKLMNSAPRELEHGQWHLPYVDDETLDAVHGEMYGPKGLTEEEALELLRKISAARCARVSYLTHDKKTPTFEEDVKLYNRLALHDPMHDSPLEHQATPDRVIERVINQYHSEKMWQHGDQHGNFYGWRQNRKLLPGECAPELNRLQLSSFKAAA